MSQGHRGTTGSMEETRPSVSAQGSVDMIYPFQKVVPSTSTNTGQSMPSGLESRAFSDTVHRGSICVTTVSTSIAKMVHRLCTALNIPLEDGHATNFVKHIHNS